MINLKKLYCKHKNMKTLTNFHGDFINIVSNRYRTIRRFDICKDCGKIVGKPSINPDCRVSNWVGPNTTI